MQACNPVRKLQEDEYLLQKNIIECDVKNIDLYEIDGILKQKPNSRIFKKIPFHLIVYNWPDTVKMKEKTLKRHARIDRKNVKREAKGKKLKEYKLSIKERIGRWLMNSVGEAPVILDSTKVRTSVTQINYYMFNKGYFDNKVSDSIYYDQKKKRAHVIYTIKADKPYVINNVTFDIEDKKLKKQIEKIQRETVIKIGDVIDMDKLDDERTRINNYLKDRGYYYFNKEFVYFKLDSALCRNSVDIAVSIHNVSRPDPKNPDSLIQTPHIRYNVANIYVNTDFDPIIAGDESKVLVYDTVFNADSSFYMIYNPTKGKIKFKPDELVQSIYISKGTTYRQKEVENTYKKLSSLGIYKNISIGFQPNPLDPTMLDCFINLVPSKRQSFLAEATGTNKGGNLGIQVNTSYRNKNVFRGGESFKFSLHGGIEAQQPVTNTDEQIIDVNGGIVTDLVPVNTFNTIEFGPEVSLNIPKFLTPFNLDKFSKKSSPSTVFTTKYNYQRRPDFTRAISEANWAYQFVIPGKEEKVDKTFNSFYFTLLNLSGVNISNETDEFIDRLNLLNDQLLINSYRDHLIIGSQLSYTFNLNSPSRLNDVFYFKTGLDWGGNLLRFIMNQTDLSQNDNGAYEILGIQYAQYVKTDIEARYYINFSEDSKLVFRSYGGIGVPGKNFDQALPFEKSFFVGGSNGLRAWKARAVGPGSYRDSLNSLDKIGDIVLEGNIEYRFDLFDIIDGALFADIGNIWNIKENQARPGSGISKNFYKELAIGAGIGLRLDLDFFVIRFDFATPVKDPEFEEGERWTFDIRRTNINVGIGYPF
jgi:outer membrane protein assembly factor BamA